MIKLKKKAELGSKGGEGKGEGRKDIDMEGQGPSSGGV